MRQPHFLDDRASDNRAIEFVLYDFLRGIFMLKPFFLIFENPSFRVDNYIIYPLSIRDIFKGIFFLLGSIIILNFYKTHMKAA